MPIAAIVGRPNVGKSTLFNKLTGQRTSIVDDTPGVTRDRIYGTCEWLRREFTLIDTGGIDRLAAGGNMSEIYASMCEQAQTAIDTADVIIFVTDLKSGLTANDSDVANILQKSGKPIILCVNKCDKTGKEIPPELYEFYNLGLGEPFPVSSVHGHGTGDLLDEVIKFLPFENGDENTDTAITAVAVIGKPNAGKSSLVNKISGQQRVIVSEIAGTTRDAIDLPLEYNGEKYVFIDTAGLRRKSKVNENIEKYSVLRAYSAIDRADVCVMMIDAEEGFTEQDSKVAGYAHDKGKASVIAINKWDLIEKSDKTMREFEKKLEVDFSFMKYAPFVFISAKTGQRLDKLFELIKFTREQNARRISTGMLNDMLATATARVQPPSDRGKRLKLYYITQADVKPPTFVIFCNRIDLFHFSYQRYIENQIRETFGLDGTPIKIIPRERGE
ncbi:MAG: ribosome biogenesis GTPase Der [Oscillospiraceae bacterium]|nr:ribosome biogenesis GTPase Der [Oscillospiraceae bacterium]